MSRAALADLAARIATNALTASQQAALGDALAAIVGSWPIEGTPTDDQAAARQWIGALYAIAAAGVDPVSGGAVAITLVDTLSALALVDVAGAPDDAPARVASVGAEFTLRPSAGETPDGITVIGASDGRVWLRGASLVGPQAQAQIVWYVDAQSGDDERDGLTPATALQHKQEIARRWGTPAPRLSGIDVVIHCMAAETAAGDDGVFAPVLIDGATLTLVGDLPPPSFTGTLLVVSPKNLPAGRALESTFTTTTGAMAEDLVLVNATRGGSRAIAHRDLGGGNWQLSQPFAPYVDGTFPTRTEVDTWADGDAIEGYAPLSVNLASLGGIAAGVPSTFGPSLVVRQMTIAAPGSSFTGVSLDLASNPMLVDVVFARALSIAGEPPPALEPILQNCSHLNQVIAGGESVQLAGGILRGGGQLYNASPTNNVIIASGCAAYNCDLDDCELFLDDGVTFDASGHTFIAGALVLGHVYGRGTYNQASGVTEYHETAADHLLCAFTIGGSSLAYSSVTVGGVTTVHQLALTAAALDAPAGLAGFGGLAFVGGSAIQRTGAAP